MIRPLRAFSFLASLLLAVAVPAVGQDIQWTRTAGPEGGRILSLENHEGTLFAGTEGGIYRFQTEQHRWTPAGFTERRVPVIQSFGSQLFVIVGGEIYQLNDDSWRQVDTYPNLSSAISMGAGERLFAGTYDGIWMSNDIGATWEHLGLESEGNPIASVEVTTSGALLAFTHNEIHRSDDGGLTWSMSTAPFFRDVVAGRNAIYGAAADGQGACQGGVYVSIDDGRSWTQKSLNCTDAFSILETNDAVFAGTSEGIFRSTDSGATWAFWGLEGKLVYSLAAGDDRLFAGSGWDGVYSSPFEAPDWSRVAEGITQPRLHEVTTDSYGRLFTTSVGSPGEPGNVCQSPDRGTSWTCSTQGITGHSMAHDVVTVSQDAVFVGTDAGVFRSEDGGHTWTRKSDGLGSDGAYVSNLLALPSGRILASEREGVFATDDFGEAWHPKLSSGRGGLLVIQNDTIYAAVDALYRSTDNGESWSTVLEDENIRAFAVDPTSGRLYMGSYDREGVYRSEDQGQSWLSAGLEESYEIEDLVVSKNGDVFASAHDDVFVSRDNGDTWHPTGLQFSNVPSLALDGEGFLYAAATNHGVYRSVEPTTVLVEDGGRRPIATERIGAYPNPMSEATTITYELEWPSDVAIEIYDMLGRRIASVDVGAREAGRHRLIWDGDHLPNGVYMLYLDAQGHRASATLVVVR